MKKSLLLAVSLMAATAVSAQANFGSFQNLEVQNAPVNVQTQQLKLDIVSKQAQGLEKKDFSGVKVNANKDIKLTPAESAYYYNPAGTFFFGAAKEGNYMKNTFLLAPTYRDLEWVNATGPWANSFEWEYSDILNSTQDNDVYATSTDRDLVYGGYSFGIFPTPILSAQGSGITSFYGIGGPAENQVIDDNGLVVFGASVGFLAQQGALPKNLGASVFDVSKNDLAFYVTNQAGDEYVAGKDAFAESMKIKGFMNAIDKPASPYFIDQEGVWAFAKVSASDDAEFTATIYEITFVELEFKDGSKEVVPQMGQEIAHCTKTFNQLKQGMQQPQPGMYIGSMSFDNFVAEDEFGYEADVVPIIDSAIAIVISGFESPKVSHFEMSTNTQAADANGAYDKVANERLITHYFALSEVFDPALKLAAPMFTNFSLGIFIDACFPWLHAEDTAFDAPQAGGSKNFKIDCFFNPSWTFVVNDDFQNAKMMDQTGNVALNDWLSASVNPNTAELTFTASALASGKREAKVSIFDLVGIQQDFWIAQRDAAGVEGVEAVANVVRVVDGNFVVSSESATEVEVFNVAGQKVAGAAINGQAVVAAQNLANGLYIVKFNDNSVVKVVK